jgi:ornithine decarboxylase
VLICEPGRGLVGDAFAYAVQVKSLRGERVYLSDGIYGGLSEFPSMGVPAFRIIGRANAATTPRIVYGPTCDSLDVLPGRVDLPTDLGLGDWIVFSATGAYLNGVTTMFNGYGGRTTVPVTQL